MRIHEVNQIDQVVDLQQPSIRRAIYLEAMQATAPKYMDDEAR